MFLVRILACSSCAYVTNGLRQSRRPSGRCSTSTIWIRCVAARSSSSPGMCACGGLQRSPPGSRLFRPRPGAAVPLAQPDGPLGNSGTPFWLLTQVISRDDDLAPLVPLALRVGAFFFVVTSVPCRRVVCPAGGSSAADQTAASSPGGTMIPRAAASPRRPTMRSMSANSPMWWSSTSRFYVAASPRTQREPRHDGYVP